MDKQRRRKLAGQIMYAWLGSLAGLFAACLLLLAISEPVAALAFCAPLLLFSPLFVALWLDR